MNLHLLLGDDATVPVDAMGALLDSGFEDPSLHSWAKQGTMTLWENGGNVPQDLLD